MDPNTYTDIKVGELATKFEASHDRIASKLDVMAAEMHAEFAKHPDKSFIRTWNLGIIGVVVAAIALVVSVISFGAQQYSNGVAVSDGYSRASAADEQLTNEVKALRDALRALQEQPSP